MDIDSRRSLGAFDTQIRPDIFTAKPCNLLLMNLELFENQMKGFIADTGMSKIRDWGSHHFLRNPTLTTQEAMFPCPPEMEELLLQQGSVLLCDIDFKPKVGDSSPNILQIGLLPTSLLIPWVPTPCSDEWVLDLCSGGFGGWSFAFKVLADYAEVPTKIVSVDHDLTACVMHSLNHDTLLLPDEPVPTNFLIDHDRSVDFCAPLKSHNWKQPVARIKPSTWTFSFPCPSWSQAAYQRGFGDEQGKTLLEGMAHAKHYQPKYILLENVAGFPEHPDFHTALALFQFCGYRVLHEGTYDIQERTPVRRARWLAVLELQTQERRPLKWTSWQYVFTTPHNWDMYTPLAQGQFAQFTLTPTQKQMYMDPNLLPKNFGKKSPAQIEFFRCPNPKTTKLSTILAAYGNQHNLPMPLLQQKGLLGQLKKDQGRLRFLTPWEISLVHCQSSGLVMLKPTRLSWKHLGNSITTHHSLLLIINWYNHVHDTTLDLHAILQDFEDTRLRASTVKLHEDSFAWYIAETTAECQTLAQRVSFFTATMNFLGQDNPIWPEQCYFHPSLGCMSLHASLEDLAGIETSSNNLVPPTEPDPPTELLRPDTPLQLENDSPISHEAPTEHMTHTWTEHSPASVDQDNSFFLNIVGTSEPLVDVSIIIAHDTYHFQVHPSLTWQDLLRIWDFVYQPQVPFDFQDRVKSQTLHFTSAPTFPVTSVIHPILCQLHDQIVILPCAQDHTFELFVQNFPGVKEARFDHLGYVTPFLVFDSPVLMNSTLVPIEQRLYLEHLHAAMLKAQLTTTHCPETNEYQLHVQADAETQAILIALWQLACPDQWLHCHHRSLTLKVIDANSCCVHFAPDGSGLPTPVQIFQKAFAIRVLQTALSSLHTDGFSIKMLIRYQDRVLKTVAVHPKTTLALFHAIIRHFHPLIGTDASPFLVCQGTAVQPDGDLNQLPVNEHEHGNYVECHIIFPTKILRFTGGGGGNKAAHKQTVSAAVASLCIGVGVTIDDVPQAVTTLFKALPFQQLSNLTMNDDVNEQHRKIKEYLHTCDIRITRPEVQTHRVKNKLQRIASIRNQTMDRQLDPMHYQLIPEFWKLSNGDAAVVHPQYVPDQPGITMLSYDQAQKWLQQGVVAVDESAIFVVGQLPHTVSDSRITKVTAPALNSNGARVLIAGWLVQMGERPVTPAEIEGEKLQTLDVQVCSVTLWQEDFSDDDWKLCVSSPVRFAKQVLTRDGFDDVLKQPWGRTFRKQQTPCTAQEATSCQFHCQVLIRDLRRLLRRSGWTGVFITPKNEAGKPSDHWRPIWLTIPKDLLETKTAGLAYVAGYIRGNKSSGIRVEASSFAECWARFKPDQPIPPKLSPGTTWKLNPFPYGVDRQVLQEWVKHISWTAEPARSLGARTWLFTAQEPPPEGLLRFNEHPLIAVPVQPRSPLEPTGLIAGPRSESAKSTAATSSQSIFRQGDPFYDPWRKPDQAQKSQSGPTATQLDNHDRRLGDLETAITTLQAAQEASQKQQENGCQAT